MKSSPQKLLLALALGAALCSPALAIDLKDAYQAAIAYDAVVGAWLVWSAKGSVPAAGPSAGRIHRRPMRSPRGPGSVLVWRAGPRTSRSPRPHLALFGQVIAVGALLAEAMARSKHAGEGLMKALMPGKVLKLFVQEGEEVEEGQPLLILEAMKMQNEYVAPVAGRVAQIQVEEGQTLEIHAPILTLEPLPAKAEKAE